MTQEKLIEQFNRIQAQQRKKWQERGIDDTLQKLSLMMRNFKDAQLDISLEVFGIANSFSFDLLPKGYLHQASGIVTIGNEQRMIAIAHDGEKPENRQIVISSFDPRFHLSTDGRGARFNLNDPEWPLQMQSEILEVLATNSLIAEWDTHKAFANSNTSKKHYFKPFPK